MNLPSYSIAIRTLGTSGEKFERELKSIKQQTIKPEKVVVYIAKGYKKPNFSINIEEYVEVEKGMMRQRALKYDEINSDYILMLDDDVELSPNSSELMLKAIIENNVQCVAADTFKNHLMPLSAKIYNIFVNLTFPHFRNDFAFIIRKNSSFSYINNPQKSFYYSQSAAGPASLWNKKTFLNLHLEHELWIERMGFNYGEDSLLFNKLYKNGYKLGIIFNSGIKHLDGGTSSSIFKSNLKRYYTRSFASISIWHRCCYNLKKISLHNKLASLFFFILKVIWLGLINLLASIILIKPKIFLYYILGIRDGIRFIKSTEYKSLPNYILK